jgi:Transposase IS4
VAFDHKTGAAAVIRNLKIVLGTTNNGFRLVIIDRFYSSVALAIQLLSMSIYVVGTIMPSRLGYDKRVQDRRKSRPRAVEHGSFMFSRGVDIPTLVCCHWWDKKPVHYLATGAVMSEESIHRNIKGGGSKVVKCPKIVTDYQRYMGGVDVHDQLRLQSYSLQTSIRFRKYYKSLFLGLVDMALVNAYLTHKKTRCMNAMAPMPRGEWMGVLQNQLLQLKMEDLIDTPSASPSPTPITQRRRRQKGHVLAQFDDWVTVSGVQKRRQRACKVCALLRGSRKKSYQTTFYCNKCSIEGANCYLCPKARREYKGVLKTCYQIWHEDFECGEHIPPSLNKRVVLRRAGVRGTRKRTSREILQADDESNEPARSTLS